MDVHTPAQRSFNMIRIKSKNTLPEGIIRKLIWSNGYRYRLHGKDLPGKPDIVFRGRKKAIFVNGCFWHMHGCRYFKWPKTNREFWKQKIKSNARRDKKNYKSLLVAGWSYIVIWECETKVKNFQSLWMKIEEFIAS